MAQASESCIMLPLFFGVPMAALDLAIVDAVAASRGGGESGYQAAAGSEVEPG